MMKNRTGLVIAILIVVLLAVVALSFFIGRYSAAPGEVWKVLSRTLAADESSYNAVVVILKVRLPRILAAILVGGALALSGATFQGIFGNPLVSPSLLGTSAGAGLGACIAIILDFGRFQIQLAALGVGLFATFITCLLSRLLMKRRDGIVVYVLVGIVISAVFQAGISIAKYMADPYTDLQTMTYWLMGSLSNIDLFDVEFIIPAVALGTIFILVNSYKINLLSFNEEEALAMGLNVRSFRLVMIIAATLLCSSSVAICGVIAWVGLVVPHIARIFVGPDSKKLLPVSFLLGCIYLLLIDDLARSLLTIEIPIGILTSAIGAPVFILLLLGGRSGWR
ncbi:MAG: iron ABC transporter permease [Syntrophomonas sp.]